RSLFSRSLSCIFFLSSRRRHTRFSRDWSSDVCSSDLQEKMQQLFGRFAIDEIKRFGEVTPVLLGQNRGDFEAALRTNHLAGGDKIGRASRRERVETTVEADVAAETRHAAEEQRLYTRE